VRGGEQAKKGLGGPSRPIRSTNHNTALGKEGEIVVLNSNTRAPKTLDNPIWWGERGSVLSSKQHKYGKGYYPARSETILDILRT